MCCFPLTEKVIVESEQAHGKGKCAHLSLPSAQKGRWDEMIAPPLSTEEEIKRNSMGEHFCFRKEKEARSGPSIILPMQMSASCIQQ